ncbi:YicC/YloC family endoribonuclease [Aureicoccus marinus]|uniref:YicC family protein n=1 Tax=Aureicoccus marinus TaxID=754435 RepID=A0A2S7T825_9FLAO|nr:YicC/YloC family endoribonuclease [Aureicoccus marinus]PQJ16079.1 YicC family protein [Aureicoccus marinus]
MIQSMTGFGKEVLQLPQKKITLELKSLNSKNLDLNARLPLLYREKEMEMRKMLSEELSRGKIDFNLQVELNGTEVSTEINKPLVEAYMGQLRTIASGDELKLMELALRLPDTLKSDKDEIDPEEYGQILEGLKRVIRKLQDFRQKEGAALEADFQKRINTLETLLEEVKSLDTERIDSIRTRLEKAVSDLHTEVDANRFEQELIYYLEKYDITEEKVRLANHLKYFSKTMETEKAGGKKLGFICQEIGREINTIGSKANFAPMQKCVVQMKDELEKIKEQMLNVL